MRAVFAFLLLLSSCAALEGSPYVEPRAAVFQDGDSLVVRFGGQRRRVVSLVDRSGGEVFSVLAADGERIGLSHLPGGEYSVFVRDFSRVVCCGKIRLL
jgi:hypothetical protein